MLQFSVPVVPDLDIAKAHSCLPLTLTFRGVADRMVRLIGHVVLSVTFFKPFSKISKGRQKKKKLPA